MNQYVVIVRNCNPIRVEAKNRSSALAKASKLFKGDKREWLEQDKQVILNDELPYVLSKVFKKLRENGSLSWQYQSEKNFLKAILKLFKQN